MRALALAFLLALPSLAHALDCTPRSAVTPAGDGMDVVRVVTLDGVAFGTWCPAPADKCPGLPEGQGCWAPSTWAGLYRLAPAATAALVGSIYTAPPGQVRQAAAEAMAAGRVQPAPGTLAACQHRELIRAACVKLRTPPCAGLPGCVDTAVQCGTAQSCAGLPESIAWVVSRSGMATTATTRPAYPYANGVRGTTSTARATIGAACDCTVRSTEGTSTYCAHDAARATVTLCRTTQ
jgi:hypothetical protein